MAKTVRGTQAEKPAALEFGKTTVYERKNIRRVEEPEADGRRAFSGWEYEETTYTYPEWSAHREQDSLDVKSALAELAAMIAGGQGDD